MENRGKFEEKIPKGRETEVCIRRDGKKFREGNRGAAEKDERQE
jgi:hypothetical protein